MSSTVRRTASLVAVTATAVTMVAVPVLSGGTASAATRAATSISIRTARPAVKPGGTDVVTGNLSVRDGSPEGRTVTLEARAKGETGFTPIALATAATHGAIHASVTPAVTTRYRWHFTATADARSAGSPVATIRVRTPQHPPTRLPTTLSMRVAHRVVGLDGDDVINSQLRSRRVLLPGRLVILISRTAETPWTFVAAERTDGRAHVGFDVHPATNTAYRTVFLGTPLLQRARSAVGRIAVRPEISITADPSQIDPGQSATVSGVVTHAGLPVAGVEVRLLGRSTGHKRHHFAVVGTSTTAADGSVSFTVTPDRTTVYRLHSVAGNGVPGGLSAALREVVRNSSSLSIRGRSAGDAYVVGGILRGHGHPLARRTVSLESQAPGTTTWVAVATGVTGPHGLVHFSEPQAPGTGYRLTYAGDPKFAASVSGTVVN